MSASDLLDAGAVRVGTDAGLVSRLIVAWQHPVRRLITPVGLLETDGAVYSFHYLRRAADVEDFEPFLGFPDMTVTYRADELFPLFAQRVMDPRRPDYMRYMTSLDLPQEASPLEQLARSGGRRTGDTIQLFPIPSVTPDGSTAFRFLVHGIRYVPGAEEALLTLQDGDVLSIEDEPTNEHNARAVLTTTRDGLRLGWVPDLLLDFLAVLRSHGPVTLTVDRVNGPEAPSHMRLLVLLEGSAPDGYEPFSGPQWALTTVPTSE